MTVKLVALWTAPNDVDGFEGEYETVHLPLAAALPGLKGAVSSKTLGGPYYRMAELMFEDAAALQTALGSEEGLRMLTDTARLLDAYGNKLEAFTVEEQGRI